ncbi:MAG TPA: hypothetical protein VJ508_17065, partial [Saprospiraceae bacterium]|nr:hypothetical protein [Saprospiraceae bacterium]
MKGWLEAHGHTPLLLYIDYDKGIPGGSLWQRTFHHQIGQHQVVIALLMPHWLASNGCFIELAL